MQSIKTLINNIRLAFSKVPYPEHDYYFAIAQMKYLDPEEVKNSKDLKKNWDSITKEELVKFGDFIFFTKDAESIYYFPTYLKLILENNDLVDYGLYISFLMKLRDIDLSLLENKQKKVIAKFIEFLKSNNYTIFK